MQLSSIIAQRGAVFQFAQGAKNFNPPLSGLLEVRVRNNDSLDLIRVLCIELVITSHLLLLFVYIVNNMRHLHNNSTGFFQFAECNSNISSYFNLLEIEKFFIYSFHIRS